MGEDGHRALPKDATKGKNEAPPSASLDPQVPRATQRDKKPNVDKVRSLVLLGDVLKNLDSMLSKGKKQEL